MFPHLVAKAARRYVEAPRSQGFLETWQELARALPTGLFDNAPIGDYLAKLLSSEGRCNDFRKLSRHLFIVATDLDTSEAIAFGSPGWDDVPISRAVQASTALPGLYPPVNIHGKSFVNGALMKTLHASVALEAGADLLFCINPLVPFDAAAAARRSHRKRVSIAERGLPTVLSQTFRSIIHSRMSVAMKRYQHEYPHADILLFEPRRDDAEMFFTNIFSYAERRRLSEHAYQAMRDDLRQRSNELAPILARHGLGLDQAILADTRRTLDATVPQIDARSTQALQKATSQLGETLDELGFILEQTLPPQHEDTLSKSVA
jgi:predicted acylesterase/phospholipase RssA